MIINHKGTQMVEDGEDLHGLQTTILKSLAIMHYVLVSFNLTVIL